MKVQESVSRREYLRAQADTVNTEERSKLDTTPVEVPLEMTRPPTIKEELQRYVRYEVSKIGQEEGFETFEEADDFEEEDLPEWSSEYELLDMEDEVPESLDGEPSEEEGTADRPVPPTDPAATGSDPPPPAQE